MPEGVARAKRWPHEALRAGRAAAFLTLATGVNGIITTYVPAWEPRWLYIAVVGLVAALDGWIVGLIAAAGSVVCYELMSFGAFRFVADRDALFLAAAVVAAVTARALRLAIHRPAAQPVNARPLLTGFTITPPAPIDKTLQEASATLRRALDEERLRYERERSLRLEQEERLREELDRLTAELRASQTQTGELRQERIALHASASTTDASLRAAALRIQEVEKTASALRGSLDEANEQRASMSQRIPELESQLASAIEDRTRAEATVEQLRKRAGDLGEEASELQNNLAEVAAARDTAAARADAAERDRDALRVRLQELESAREETSARNNDLQWSQTQLRQQLTEAEVSVATLEQRNAQLEVLAEELKAGLAAAEAAAAEAARGADAIRAEAEQQRTEFDQARYRLDSEWNEKLARNAVELTDRLNAALMEADARVDAAKADAAALLERVAQLERENTDYREQLEQEFGSAVDLNSRLQQLESENAEIRTSSAALHARLESEWRDQLEDRETAIERMSVSLSVADQRARSATEEAAALRTRIDELEQTVASLREASESASEADAELQALRSDIAKLATELEAVQKAHSEAVETSESLLARTQELESENQSLVASTQLSWESERAAGALRARLAELDSELQAARDSYTDERLRLESDWSEKFARSAMEITARFQNELAAAAEEGARYREEIARLSDQVAVLTQENSAIREASVAERGKLDAEWSEKLQTIVAHLASDHEHDMGEAMVEREEAKAEARRLSNKLSQIESRARDVAEAFEWLQKQNQQLQSEIDELKQRPAGGASDSEWSAKLAANALELTQRFNAAMATAEGRLQEAKQESHNLAARIRELEQINSTLRLADQERRAAIDAEWSEKLETIVNHLATDHEADVGQAMMEREEARAQARMNASKAEKLQKTLEDQFAFMELAKQEWIAEREQLLKSIDVLRRRMGLGTYSGTTPVPAPEAQPERSNAVVLVVHRDSAVRAIAKHALETTGYEVVTASDGLEAFRVATAQHPAVILAEASMPKLDGRELVQMLKSRPETAAVKIVLMADAQGESGRYSMSDFRADDFLRDPANVEALKTTLANVLGARI